MKRSKQPFGYTFWAWLGRKLYLLRSELEHLQAIVDERAGKFWQEDW